MEVPGHQQVEDEDKHADAQHQLAQSCAQLLQLLLQGGLLIGGRSQCTGDFAHFGVHAGAGDDGLAPAIDHGGAHIAHIFPVAQRNLLLLSHAQCLQNLGNGHRLAGEGGFLDFQAGTFDDPSVCRDGITGFQNHDVSGHHLVGVQNRELALPDDFTGGGGHGLQGFNGGLRLALLQNT